MTWPPKRSSSEMSAWKTRLRFAVSTSAPRCEPSSLASASVSGVKPEMSANSAAPWTVCGGSRCPSRARAGGHRQCGRPRCRSGSFPCPLASTEFRSAPFMSFSSRWRDRNIDFIDCPTRRMRIGPALAVPRTAPGFALPGRCPRKIAENMLLCIVAPHLGAMRSADSALATRPALPPRRAPSVPTGCPGAPVVAGGAGLPCDGARYANMTQPPSPARPA